MSNLTTLEIKAFVPAKDFEQSKQFYQDFGFTLASDTEGVAYFHHGNCSFLLQSFYEKALAENLMMHLLVEDAYAWHDHLTKTGIADRYNIRITGVESQAWGMLDFVVVDPSGVLWRVGQNI